MHITIDRDKCLGVGNCEAIAPEYFEIDADGILVVLQEEIEPSDLELIGDCARTCPTGAISLTENVIA